jgi:hypothetical protein
VAGIDYFHCAVCRTKAFYDANVDYENSRIADALGLCKDCVKTHELVVREKCTLFPNPRCIKGKEVKPAWRLKDWI